MSRRSPAFGRTAFGLTTVVLAAVGFAALAVPTWACGAAPTCVHSTECGPGLVCQPSGACAPLEDEAELGTMEIGAHDWAVTTAHDPGRRSPDTDVLLLGGATEATVHLAFDLRGDGARRHPRVRRAILRLVPTAAWSGPRAPARVVVHRSGPFDGTSITHRNAPRPTGSVIAAREIDGPPRPLTLDVTAAVIDAERFDDPNVYLVIRQVGSSAGPMRFASPRAEDRRRRPALSLFLR